MAVYTSFQGDAGLVGAPDKPSLTDSKVEEKPNEYAKKQTKVSF